MPDTIAIVDRIARDVVAPRAVEVDRDRRFPREAIDALRDAGLLGLVSSAEVGGKGRGPRAAFAVVERLARDCGSTAMVVCMHYAGAAVIETHGSDELRRQVAAGEHLCTLAFSEAGSRSHFWAPLGTARAVDGGIRLDGKKSFVTSAQNATVYVWSSQPVAAEGASTLWAVPAGAPGLTPTGEFDGLGLRGNDSTPMVAAGVQVTEAQRLGDDGAGLSVMLETVLPIFNVMTSACAIGLMEGATAAACTHASATRHEHLGASLAELPTIRAYLARLRIATDQARLLALDTISALESGREDALLRVLECKAAAGESATAVLDTAMRVCGGAAFRRDLGIERRFRDARAGTVMAPTTDQLYDFIGKALCGLPVF